MCDIVHNRKYKLPSSNQNILPYLYSLTYQNRNKSCKPECALSFNMALRFCVEYEVQHSIFILGPKPPYRNIKYNCDCFQACNIAFFIIMLFSRLSVRIDILITRGKHLHDGIISQGRGWGHKTRLAPPLCIAVPVSVHTSERSCCFVLKVSIFLFLRYTYLIVHSSVFLTFIHVI